MPFVMAAFSSESDFFCTSAERRSFAPNFFPMTPLPLPSAAWHTTHLVLYRLAASSARVDALKKQTNAHAKNSFPQIWTPRQFISVCLLQQIADRISFRHPCPLSLERIQERERKIISIEILQRKCCQADWIGDAVIVVSVVVPSRLVRQSLVKNERQAHAGFQVVEI